MFSNAGLPAPLPTELSSFVGREREVAEVRRLLMTARMLTLTGTGGVGKTRLAMRVAAEIQRETAVPVRLAELGGIASSALLPQAVVSALGVFEHPGRSPTEVLIEVLQQQPVCLVLDNCEHVIAASAELAERLLRGCPELQILATSREPLRVRGETVWRVPSLTLPPKPRGHMSSEQVAQSEAVRLFIERAQVSLPEFALDDLNAAAIAEVCRKLDGIPLALELAAGRVAVLSVEQLTERLDHALGLLTEAPRGVPGRQQTLRATLDWSHSLLTETEQFLLARLSVFAGGWTLDAAEAVGADQAMNRREVLDVLAGLVAKSLVLSERHKPGPYRYRMLETIRQYGREKLMERGEADPVRRRHAEYFVRLAEQLQVELLGHGARAALDELEQEQDNLRASLDWMLEREEAEQAQRLAGALGRFWQLRCHFGEGQAWVRRALSLPTPEPRTAERGACTRLAT